MYTDSYAQTAGIYNTYLTFDMTMLQIQNKLFLVWVTKIRFYLS